MSQNLVWVSEEQTAYMESVGSSFRFSIESTATAPEKRVCELVDIATSEPWNKTVGDEWQETFNRCIETSRTQRSLKPKTSAEIAQDAMLLAEENARLRELVEAAQSQSSAAPKRKAQTTDPS